MQFGYALGLAAIFTYWKQIGSTDFKEKLLVVLLIGYGIYLHFLADILPWFTVCTSLGQLVNKERLHETMAKMKLNEEVRRVEAAAEAAAIEKEISMRRRQVEEKLQAKKQQEEEMLKHRVCDSVHLRNDHISCTNVYVNPYYILPHIHRNLPTLDHLNLRNMDGRKVSREELDSCVSFKIKEA
jgi:hypothetical protein